MPNVCHNYLTVQGPRKELNRFVSAASGTGQAGRKLPFSLQSLYPNPNRLYTGQPIEDLEEWNWDSWCLKNWGTIRDVLGVPEVERRSAKEWVVAFDTALAK